MASKRGLSTEEKRKRMLEFFFEKQDFFQLKDIEKLCSQEKGITIQTVKDILTSLVDDGLVNSEKIGTSIYFWSLPSKTLQNKKDNLVKIETNLKTETARNASLKERLEKAQIDEEEEEKRAQLQLEYERLLEQKQKLIKEIEQYKDNDPEVYEQMKRNIVMCKTACNRWVENIYNLRSWLKNKFRIDESTINKQFEIPDDLDYVN